MNVEVFYCVDVLVKRHGRDKTLQKYFIVFTGKTFLINSVMTLGALLFKVGETF